nr:MAG TPA: hypothetical protein [Caudoviricetes sp.]
MPSSPFAKYASYKSVPKSAISSIRNAIIPPINEPIDSKSADEIPLQSTLV